MKSLFAVAIVFAGSFASAAKINFHCSNAPASVWGEYYAISAETEDFQELKVFQFGLVEGSSAAGEEEPVDTIENVVVKADPTKRATSAQWKNAVPFDLSSPNLGPAVLYINTADFSVSGSNPVVRLKVAGKDLRLSCGF